MSAEIKDQEIPSPHQRYMLLDLESEDDARKRVYQVIKFVGQVDGLNVFELTEHQGTLKWIRPELEKLNAAGV